MQLACPSCAAVYEVPAGAIGPAGRRVRCRACGASWFEPGRGAPAAETPSSVLAETPSGEIARPALAPATIPSAEPPPPVPPALAPDAAPAAPVRRRRVPWLLLGLGAAVVAGGVAVATVAFGPDQVATRLGLSDERSPLGIAITRPPDWRLIAGGSQLFAVSGRIWNPTATSQPVPDILAELKDGQGRTVYRWVIARPVARLAPGASASFDGAAVDVPPGSANVSVALARPGEP